MNLEQEIKQAREVLEKLIAKAEQNKESMFPEIDVLDRYYSVNGLGRVEPRKRDFFDSGEFYIQIGNAFPLSQKEQAEVCAKYMRDTFWFVRKSLEFADGYAFKQGSKNWRVVYGYVSKEWQISLHTECKDPSTIYMSQENASSFKEWLKIHKPNGV